MFWFKRNKIELIAYTDNPELVQMFPVIESNKMFPSYYQTLDARFRKPETMGDGRPDSLLNMQSTIRGCYGINNYNNEGIILPLWSEFIFMMNGGQCEGTGVHRHQLDYHSIDLYKGSLDPFHIFKMHSPWEFRCNKEIKWLLLQNYFAANSDKWNIVPGLTDFTNQTTTNIFLAINREQPDCEIMFRGGTPLVKYIPLTEDDVQLRIEIVDDVKKVKIKPFKYFFGNGLTKMMRAKKQTQERVGKCPFHK
jgi:hypothetical protein